MNLVDPWSILFNTSEPIFHQVPIAITFNYIYLRIRIISQMIIPGFFSQPSRIIAINPRNYEVYFFCHKRKITKR